MLNFLFESSTLTTRLKSLLWCFVNRDLEALSFGYEEINPKNIMKQNTFKYSLVSVFDFIIIFFSTDSKRF